MRSKTLRVSTGSMNAESRRRKVEQEHDVCLAENLNKTLYTQRGRLTAEIARIWII